jgi:perosamine synthetase
LNMLHELPPTAGLPLTLQDIAAAFDFAGRQQHGYFEQDLAAFLESPGVDIYSSGTLCLSIAFEALKEVTGRSRVIIPAYTCPLVAIAAEAAGVEVVLCDIQSGNFQLELSMLEKLCDRSIAAVVPTDIAGFPCEITPVREIAGAAGAYVLEDAAQALGARARGRPVGSEADLAVYSLAAGKGLSLYDGGVLSVKDPELRQQTRKVAGRRVKKEPQLNLLRFGQLLGLWLFYNPCGLTWVYGQELRHWLKRHDPVRAVGDYFDFAIPAYEFDDVRKRIGAAALKRLPEFVQDNRQRGLARREILEREQGLSVPGENSGAEGSWPFLVVMTEHKSHRDCIMDELWQSGLGVTRLFIHDLASYDYLRKIVPQVEMPNARSFADRSFSITNSHFLADSEFGTIVQRLKSTYEGSRQ